ncbi:PREDICTED: uncharacterized protein LOC106296847 isoform X1 [Brassica oleracea var. oleracea]|uniref:uncharacterized protein LOC106296847 isoform X1 n=1 Tax=Brassica oleracea var. oleracea TaxID=109376 RepID=UPI0006A7340C|nr:PREDICTED: uncharacterized protein LOC106296847 isoform X1 [Brassica oleracea var. oleracea]
MSNRSMLSSRPLVVGLWLRIMCSSVESSQNMFFHNPIDKPKPLPRPLKLNHNIKISTGIAWIFFLKFQFMFLNKDLHDLFLYTFMISGALIKVLLLANTNILLPDIGGEVMGIKTTHNALICRGAASVITNPSHCVYISVSMTSRRLDSHGMVEENRSETALPGARAIVPEMTAECGEANSSGTWALCKEGMH